jgi:MoxR-like ATPase
VEFNGKIKALEDSVCSVLKGKRPAVKMAAVCLLARGHLLIDDVPGVGKTTLALSLARSINCAFRRIQFTSDLLPADITGVSVYKPDLREFEFKPGPIFANIVLADEINRTNPKTQSALLEAMNEKRVSFDGQTFSLPEPFMVIATRNPVEHHGTFPLPESQLDRFMMQITLGYPAREFEKEILIEQKDYSFSRIEGLSPVLSAPEVTAMQKEAASLRVEGSVVSYILAIAEETRKNEKITLGASTRAAQYLMRAAMAKAYYEGRHFVTPGDVKEIAPYVLPHRIFIKNQGAPARDVIAEVLAKVPVPV